MLAEKYMEAQTVRQICRKCKRRISQNRSAHLRNEHGIDSRRQGAVAEHFAEASEFGLTQKQLEQIPEGEVISVDN